MPGAGASLDAHLEGSFCQRLSLPADVNVVHDRDSLFNVTFTGNNGGVIKGILLRKRNLRDPGQFVGWEKSNFKDLVGAF